MRSGPVKGLGILAVAFPLSACLGLDPACWLLNSEACEAVTMALTGENKHKRCQWLFWGHFHMEVELI
ncbi:uncharacterized [Tachysurus ichikawai]